MSNIPSVTNPTDKPEVTKLVTTPVVPRKKPLSRKISDIVFGGETPIEFGRNILENVFVPAAQNMIADLGIGTIERAIFGSERSSARRGYAGYGYNSAPMNPLNYGAFSSLSSNNMQVRPSMTRRGRATHNFDELPLATMAEAKAVLDRMLFIVGKYGSATVADLYELLDVPVSPQDENWGWIQLSPENVGVHRAGRAFILDIPNPQPLQN